ncbi:noc1p [Trichoderma arundinaceum]|uniref:Noc1p n=1 Tax=Trichoderma arundinaceum TaxID=490622 RepID=A0A395NT68_TRIAR|nr:noc1p [Trichoderma arundinaceum]
MSLSTTTTSTAVKPARSNFSRSLRRPSITASTPDLGSVYSTQSKLLRKTSLAALTPSSLASIPDVSESYAIDSVLNETCENTIPEEDPETPSAMELSVGDAVNVPGGMAGTVRFVGTVQGKKGTFVGVELDSEYAARGKNNGDVDGVSYFSTNVAGAGIFVPVAKALRKSSGSSPMTPTASGLKLGMGNSVSLTPPTSSLSKLSASLGPGSRAPSPQGKKPRPSLSHPDSPQRKMAMSPGPRPSISAPAVRAPSRLNSPTNRLAQSVRGTAGHMGDPNKKGAAMERRPSFGGPRSASSLGPEPLFDEEPAPISMPPPPTKSSTNLGASLSLRPPSRATTINDEEIERLRAQLEDRDRQLKEQAATLAEMESSLTELQTLIESPEGLGRRTSLDDKDAAQLRHMLREKNDKIAMLAAEFDAHRADFRSTIDTLEMASTETERVYEKRIEELIADVRELESRNLDVDSVATQLKQLEELVQELEEGLEDARRGEAEARGEAEFLRGEVERTRSELRREKEKVVPHNISAMSGDSASLAKELEQKEDEIRGLKAIIHSLSRDSIPGAEGHTPRPRPGSLIGEKDAIENKIARDNLERQVAELQQILKEKSHREEELQHEIEFLRSESVNVVNTTRNSAPVPRSIQRSSIRDSRDTIISVRSQERQSRSPELSHQRASTLDTMHESDTYSTATETSTLWCEICETGGHDILTCTNMFGNDSAKSSNNNHEEEEEEEEEEKAEGDTTHEDLKPLTPTGDEIQHPAVLTPGRPKEEPASVPAVRIIPNPMESGPVAGKESGILDPEKWCAICERDGHDSVDCPFEDAF